MTRSHAVRSPGPAADREGFLDRAQRRLDSYAVRLVLSFLIILSVVPLHELLEPTGALDRFGGGERVPFETWLDLVFFAVFGPEFVLRAAIFVQRQRRQRHRAREFALLVLDLIAVLSFLPFGIFVERGLGYVRILRLSRMVLLAGYWGGMVSDLWDIVTGRERRYQVVFVLSMGLMLSFAGAVLLWWIAPADRQGSFLETLWWSFRQVQDPGNLVQAPRGLVILGLSVLLTLSGVLLFSFVVGIGTTAIEELLNRARTLPLGLRDHSVVLGLGEHSHFLLEEFADIYSKNRRELRSAVLGPTALPPAWLRTLRAGAFRYRQGDPVSVEDLARVDVEHAKRVIVLGTDTDSRDAGVIAAILATRDRNPTADLYADIEHEANLAAARSAGGARTHIVGSGSFVGDYVAQNVIFPGIYRLHRQLLTSAGCEIYTYVFEPQERRRMAAATGRGATIDAVAQHARALVGHGVTLLGWFVAPPDAGDVEVEDLRVVLHPGAPLGPDFALDGAGRVRWHCVRGVVGVALRFAAVEAFGRAIAERPGDDPAPEPVPGAPGLRLELPAGRVRRVVVCGHSKRVPRVVTELIAFYGPIDVRVLSREAAHLRSLAQDLQAAMERRFPGREVTVTHGAARHEFRLPAEHGTASVHLFIANWTDARQLARDPDVAIHETDVLLLLPSASTPEPQDGQVALDCLQLSHLEATGALRLARDFRVVGMVQDPVKGDLLESRLDRMAGPGLGKRFTIVAGERVRHRFVVQNVFVHGLNTVFLELFATGTYDICRLVPTAAGGGAPCGPLAPWDLARHLLVERRLVLIGIEVVAPSGDGTRQVLLDPREFAPGAALRWDDVRALYALGSGRDYLDGSSSATPVTAPE